MFQIVVVIQWVNFETRIETLITIGLVFTNKKKTERQNIETNFSKM